MRSEIQKLTEQFAAQLTSQIAREALAVVQEALSLDRAENASARKAASKPKAKTTKKAPTKRSVNDPTQTFNVSFVGGPKKTSRAKPAKKATQAFSNGLLRLSRIPYKGSFKNGIVKVEQGSDGRFEATVDGHTHRCARERDLVRYLRLKFD